MPNIPISKLSLETISVNSKTINGSTNIIYKILLYSNGINNTPHSLFANSGFDINSLSHQLNEDVLEV